MCVAGLILDLHHSPHILIRGLLKCSMNFSTKTLSLPFETGDRLIPVQGPIARGSCEAIQGFVNQPNVLIRSQTQFAKHHRDFHCDELLTVSSRCIKECRTDVCASHHPLLGSTKSQLCSHLLAVDPTCVVFALIWSGIISTDDSSASKGT